MRVKPWGDMDPQDHWGWLYVDGQVVLDVGADWGSTADFFLSRGAAGVIAVECDPRYFKRLEALASRRYGLKALQKRISSVKDWQNLLMRFSAHVVKVDCEGCEGFLLDLDDHLLRQVGQWAIEVHDAEMAALFGNPFPWKDARALRDRLVDKLMDAGFVIAKDVPHGTGYVVYGIRKDLDVPGKLIGDSGAVHLVILSTQRSGTKLLEECLGSHPDVEIGGEVLREIPPYAVRSLRDFFEGGTAPVRVCRLMYNQVSEPVILWLQMKEVKIIHLIREDHLRREVSNDINRRRREVGRASAHAYEEWEPVKIEADIPWILERIRLAKHEIGRFRRLFSSGLYLEVTYTDMVGYEGAEVSELSEDVSCQLLRFLDLDPAPLTSRLRKQNPLSLEETVTNYAELMRAVWRDYRGSGRFRQRSYASYADYVEHQASKLETIDLAEYHDRFREVLRERLSVLSWLGPGEVVLCLGARSGAEVEAFLDLGHPAVGIDLNPGEDNPLVVEGDFHDLEAESGSVDVVFTNSWDHAYDLRKAIGEARRVLKPEGLLIVEAVPGLDEGAHVDPWDCMIWRTRDDLVDLLERSGFTLLSRTCFDFPWKGEQLCLKKA